MADLQAFHSYPWLIGPLKIKKKDRKPLCDVYIPSHNLFKLHHTSNYIKETVNSQIKTLSL